MLSTLTNHNSSPTWHLEIFLVIPVKFPYFSFFVSPWFQGHTVLTSDEPLQSLNPTKTLLRGPFSPFRHPSLILLVFAVLSGTSSIFAFCVFSTRSLWTPGHRVRGHYRQSLDRNVCIHTGTGQHCPGLLWGQGRSGRCLLNYSFLPLCAPEWPFRSVCWWIFFWSISIAKTSPTDSDRSEFTRPFHVMHPSNCSIVPQFKQNPDAWLIVGNILQESSYPQTKCMETCFDWVYARRTVGRKQTCWSM